MGRSETAPLVGRARELTSLTSAIADAARGTLRVALVNGEPGIGKSRLVAEAIGQAGEPFRIITGQGHEMERERPFGVIADALRLDDLATDGGGDGDPRAAVLELLGSKNVSWMTDGFADLRFQIVEAVLVVLREWSSDTPLLMLLEDLHWADPSSLVVLEQVARRLSNRAIAVVGTYRPSPRSIPIEQLRRSLGGEVSLHVRLGPLPAEAVADLTERLAGGRPGPRLTELVAGAAGNPFFVTELIGNLVELEHIEVSTGRAELTGPDVVPTLRSTVLRRLRFLPEECLDVLRVASIIGSRFRLDDLSVVVDRPASELHTTLEEAWRTGLLVDDGSSFAFRHHLVWDAIYHELPLVSREGVHVQVARRLAAAGRSASQVATHFLAGAQPGDREAIEWLDRAAFEAMSRAPAVAANLLRGAIQLAGDDPQVRDRCTAGLATALAWSGQLAESETVLDELVATSPAAANDPTIRLAMAQVLVMRGKSAAARPHYEFALPRPDITQVQHARAMTDLAMACLLTGDIAGAQAGTADALAAARAIGDDPATCGAMCTMSWLATLQGRTQDAVQLAEQAVRVADASADRETARRYPHVFLAVVLLDADQPEDGRQMFDRGRRAAEAFGDTWQLPIHHLGAALADFNIGKYDDALASMVTADEIVEEVGHRVLFVWSSALEGVIAIERDDLTEAQRLLELSQKEAEAVGPGLGIDWLMWAKARLLEAEGDVRSAADLLRGAWDLAGSLGIISQRRLIGPDLVRLMLATGDTDMARSAAQTLSEAADLGGVSGVRVAAERCLGMVDGDVDRVLAAAELARSCPQPVGLAQSLEDAASLLAGAGRADEAVTALREAAQIYHVSGARRSERRVDAALRELGVKRGRRDRRSSATTGWDALTPTEREVAKLAAEGLTNPEIGRRLFVSPRTVETHLSHIYQKVSVTSRVELAAAMASRPAVDAARGPASS